MEALILFVLQYLCKSKILDILSYLAVNDLIEFLNYRSYTTYEKDVIAPTFFLKTCSEKNHTLHCNMKRVQHEESAS